MGVLSDIVIAGPSSAQAITEAEDPSESFDGVDVPGLSTIMLGTLHELVLGEAYDAVKDYYNTDVASASDEGPWVFPVKPDLRQALADMDTAKIQDVATAWAKTEEFILDGFRVEDVTSLLQRLTEAAGRAATSNLELFLCISL